MSFNIVKNAGQVNTAQFEGVTVNRQEHIAVIDERLGGLIPCAPYDDHFVFEIPKSRARQGQSPYMCTCGSAAVIANPTDVRGRMFICLLHGRHGHHQTSVVNKKDFEQQAGQVLTAKGRKWLV